MGPPIAVSPAGTAATGNPVNETAQPIIIDRTVRPRGPQ
jgi:hypothetical protein